MTRILELDEDNLTVTAGRTGSSSQWSLPRFAEDHRILLSSGSGRKKSATIGGNISTNAGGMRAVKYSDT